jgi:hypothetical protein
MSCHTTPIANGTAATIAAPRCNQTEGYRLVGCNITGVNAFFVRSDLCGDLFTSPATAAHLYQPPRHELFRMAAFEVGHPATRANSGCGSIVSQRSGFTLHPGCEIDHSAKSDCCVRLGEDNDWSVLPAKWSTPAISRGLNGTG